MPKQQQQIFHLCCLNLSIETVILFFLGYSDKFSDLAQNFLTVNVVVDVKRDT